MTITPELVNQWRIIPRAIVVLYGYIFYDVIQWFMTLDDPNAAQSAFVSVVVGSAAVMFKFYVDSGATLKELKESRL